MGRSAVEVEVVLLDILAVITLAVRHTKESFLQDGIAPIPHSDREAELLLIVRDSGEPILPPTVGTRAGLIMREVIPGISIMTIVFAHRSPLSLTQIRTPLFPRNPGFSSIVQACLLGRLCISDWRV